MKAAIYQGNHRISVEEIPIPKAGVEEVLIQVKACGICGTDVHIFEGAQGAADCNPPCILGHEYSGVITEIGENVEGLAVGDRVCVDPNDMCGKCYYCRNGLAHFCENMIGIGTTVDGGFAQYTCVKAKQVYKLGGGVSFEEGAMVEPIACCLHGMDMCGVREGSTAFIIGGGTIGMIILQLAKLAGATTLILSDPVKVKRDLAKKLGADIVIDPVNQDIQAVLDQNGIFNIDTAIECVGSPRTMQDCIRYAGKNSVAMLFGLTDPNAEIPLKPFDVFRKEVTIKASFINPYTQRRALDILQSGRIDVKSLIHDYIPLKELGDVLADPSRRTDGKVIVRP